jgi:TolC family type I secretion outer membrane protein
VNNPKIKSQREELQSIDESVAQAVSGFRPSASAQYNTGRQRTDFNHAGWEYGNTHTKQLSVSQPIFRGGGTYSSWKAARQRVKAGQQQLSAIEQQVLLQAVTAYMDVVANSALLQIARNNHDVLKTQLQSANDRFKVGEVTNTDVAQSRSRVSEAQTSIINAEGQLLGSMATFERVVGFKPEGTLAPPEKLPPLPASLAEALDVGRKENPQLLGALHAAKGAKYDVRTNEAVLLPSVNLVGAMSRQDGAGVSGQDKFDQDSLSLQFAIPLYQSGAEWSRVREARAVARQRDQESMDTRLAIDQSITQSWEELETAINIIGTRDEQIKSAEAALEGVKKEQEYGARTVLDVLDAQQEVFVARTNLVRAQRDRIVAAYNLAFSLGQMTPSKLNLRVAQYDPEEHAKDVEWQPIGF